jgi:hypothetical protein
LLSCGTTATEKKAEHLKFASGFLTVGDGFSGGQKRLFG